jgi:AraC-like DNA-binding protein
MPWGVLCAQDSLPSIPIHYTENPLTIDGDSSDWQDIPASRDFRQHNPISRDANAVRIRLAWDEQFLYLLAQVADRHIVVGEHSRERLHLNDALELYIDPLGDSGERMDVNDYQFIVNADGEWAVLKGDLARIADSSQAAPKEFGIATLLFSAKTRRHDGGYDVELSVPFAGMGLQAREGLVMPIDVCIDDLDTLVDITSLPDSAEVPRFYYGSWTHTRDFSFPPTWPKARLQGHASAWSQFTRRYSRQWPMILLLTVVVALGGMAWMAYRIRRLKDVLRRPSPASLMQATGGVQADVDAPVQAEASSQAPASPRAEHPVIVKCRAHILAHLDRDIRPEDLADLSAMSLRQLQRIFKEQLDMSPGNLVVVLKMERAAALLRAGQLNVSEVGQALGYEESAYFSRVFRKYYGQPPSAFRQG